MLFIADEVQSGFARTGTMFAIEQYDVRPDIVCMAKGIASGFPFSALGTRRELDDLWPTGSHGGTYGGNAIGCAAALATIEVLTADGFMDGVRDRGRQLWSGLRELQDRHDGIVDVRGPGEVGEGMVTGAVHLQLASLLQRASELDPAVPTVVYCAGGYRSSIAASTLRSLGFNDVSDIVGGYGAWKIHQSA